jgi:hypothetical protein
MYEIAITYVRDLYGTLDQTIRVESVEEAAQIYESEAGTETPPVAQLVEELGFEGLRLESLDTETGKKVVVGKLEEAVV